MTRKKRLRKMGVLPAPLAGEGGRSFAEHNLAAKTHGAHVSALRLGEDPRTAELADAIRETQPVAHPADEGAIWRLALVYRRLELSQAALDRADEALSSPLAAYDDRATFLGRLREDFARWVREAGRIEAELGRTTLGRSRLGLHLATARRQATLADLHALAAEEETLDAEAEEEPDAA